MMYRSNKLIALLLLVAFVATPAAGGQSSNKTSEQKANFDPIEFIKGFKMGMSYTEVQQGLPKDTEQDILSYIVGEEVFLLVVDLPARDGWSASFKFDTLDTPMRRPEQLVEMSCSATVSSRSEPFDTIVRKVTEVFGQPARMEHREEKIREAGWRVSGGSVLTLEYSIVPTGLEGKDVSLDFIIKKNKRPQHSSKAVA
jgi:hypothetical protein